MGSLSVCFDDDELRLIRLGRKSSHFLPHRPATLPAPGTRLDGLEAYRISLQSWRLFQDGALRIDYRVGGSRDVRLGFEESRRLVTLASESWIPPRQMSRWASRFDLIVLDIRSKAMSAVTQADAVCGGFRSLMELSNRWDQIHRSCGSAVDTNPTVWILLFRYSPRQTQQTEYVEVNNDHR